MVKRTKRNEVFQKQIEEIQKHRWLESERVGYDVGMQWAAEDWVYKYAEAFRMNWGSGS